MLYRVDPSLSCPSQTIKSNLIFLQTEIIKGKFSTEVYMYILNEIISVCMQLRDKKNIYPRKAFLKNFDSLPSVSENY